MQSQILVVALVPGRESDVDVEIVETQQKGGSDCHESGVCVDALAGNCDGDGGDDDDDDDDIYIMVKCLSVTKNHHFLLGVSCNHLNHPKPLCTTLG